MNATRRLWPPVILIAVVNGALFTWATVEYGRLLKSTLWPHVQRTFLVAAAWTGLLVFLLGKIESHVRWRIITLSALAGIGYASLVTGSLELCAIGLDALDGPLVIATHSSPLAQGLEIILSTGITIGSRLYYSWIVAAPLVLVCGSALGILDRRLIERVQVDKA